MLGEVLREREGAILRRWNEVVLEIYPARAGEVLRREQDRFANPLGHAIRGAVRDLYATVTSGSEGVSLGEPLRDLVKILAVQELAPSQALAFIFRFKDALRLELGTAAASPAAAEALARLDRRLDLAALAAFDGYVACREQLLELRRRELRRSQSWLEEKLSQRNAVQESP